MFAASRSINQRNLMLQKVEINMTRTERKLERYFGPLAQLDEKVQIQADKGNLLECQIQYLNVAVAAGRDANFDVLYEDYKAALDCVREKLIERYRHALLFKEKTAEAEPLSESERELAVENYQQDLQNLIAPFYDFRLNPHDNFPEWLEEVKVAYDNCEAIMDELYEMKEPLAMAYREEEEAYAKRRENFVVQTINAITHPLIQACEQGDLESVAALIKKSKTWWAFNSVKSYINSAQENNFYALHVLIRDYKNDPTCSLKGNRWIMNDKKNRAAIAKLLLENGASVNQLTEDNYTPLHLAAKHGHEDLAKILIDFKANVNAVASGEGYNRTPLHFAAYNGYAAIVRLLLQHKANVSAITSEVGKMPLHEAAMGDVEIVALLVKNGADVNALTTDGYSVLADVERPETALYLLEHGTLIPKDDEKNNLDALLSVAYARGNKGLIQVLIDYAVSLFESNLHKCGSPIQNKEKIQAYKETLQTRYALQVRTIEDDSNSNSLPQAYHNDGNPYLDLLDESLKIEIMAWLDYKSRVTMGRVSRYWCEFNHNDLIANQIGRLLNLDDINDAQAYMNAQRSSCDELVSEKLNKNWQVVRLKPMANSVDWIVELRHQDKPGNVRRCYLSANVLSNYAQRYREGLSETEEVFHTISLS